MPLLLNFLHGKTLFWPGLVFHVHYLIEYNGNILRLLGEARFISSDPLQLLLRTFQLVPLFPSSYIRKHLVCTSRISLGVYI